MKNKILIVTPGGLPFPSIKGGAVQNLIENIVRECQNADDKNVCVVAPFDKEAYEVAEKQYPCIRFYWIKIPKLVTFADNAIYYLVSNILKRTKSISFRNNAKTLWYAFKIGKLIKKEKFSQILIENNIRLFLCLRFYGNLKRYHGRIAFHLHNIPRSALGLSNEIRDCSKYLCVSKYVGDVFSSEKSAVKNIDKNKVYVYRNCIDTTVFKPRIDPEKTKIIRGKYGFTSDDVVFMFAGRLSPEKGIKETLEAFLQVNNSKAKLLIIGSYYYGSNMRSDFEDEIERLASQKKENIKFTGYISYTEIADFYRASDIAVLPSIWEEPAGLTMLEAMACGLPVITTNAGGITDYVADDCSIIINRDEKIVSNLLRAMYYLLDNPEERKEMGKLAAVHAEKYNCHNYYQEFLQIMGV